MTQHDFAHEMSDDKDHWFSYEGAMMLYEYIEWWIDDKGFCFDAVALRCEYDEYSLEEYKNDYPEEVANYLEEEELKEIKDEEEFFNYIQNNNKYCIWIDYSKDIILLMAH